MRRIMNWHALDKNIDDRIEEKKLRGFGGVGDNEHIEVEKEVSLIRDSHPLAILWDFLIFSLTIFHTYDIAFKYAFLTSTPGRSATFSRRMFPRMSRFGFVITGPPSCRRTRRFPAWRRWRRGHRRRCGCRAAASRGTCPVREIR